MILNNFQWYRRMRGGCWGKVTGLMFEHRWVKVGPECADRIEESWGDTLVFRDLLVRTQGHLDHTRQKVYQLEKQLRSATTERPTGIELELARQLTEAREQAAKAYQVAEECGKYIFVIEKRVAALRGEVESMKTRKAKKAGGK